MASVFVPPNEPSISQRFLRGLQAGQQERQQEEERTRKQAQEKEDRDLRKLLLDQEKRKIAIEEKLSARKLAQENLQMQQGQPMADLPLEGGVLPSSGRAMATGMPSGAMAPQFIGAGPEQLPQAAAMSIPGVPELGVGGMTARPHTREEQLRDLLIQQQQAQQAEINKPRVVGQHDRVMAGSQEIARGLGPDQSIAANVSADNARADAAAAEAARHNRAMESGQGGADTEWVIRNGTVLQIPKGTAKPGDRPYAASQAPTTATSAAGAYANERASRIMADVDGLLGQVGVFTTGPGSVLASIPGSGARDFKAKLETLKANVAFNELTEMRNASKTGGALGAVSDREGSLLQSALGALDTGQSPTQFREQLQKVRDIVLRWQATKEQMAAGSGAAPAAAVKPSAGRTADPLGIR